MNPPCGEGIHSITLVCLGVNFNPKMARSKRKAFPEGTGPFPENESGSGKRTVAEILWIFKKRLRRSEESL